MINTRNAILVAHLILITAFIVTHSPNSYQLLLALLCHYLILSNDSACYQKHCSIPGVAQQRQRCGECKRVKWVRMRHCYKCGNCVHKYDHHCVLMDICIGQFNHRYYLLFLACFLWNIAKMLFLLTEEIREQVSINQLGVQSYSAAFYGYAVALMCLYFLAILTGYLLGYHVYLCSNNATTWQSVKRDNIGYLKQVDTDVAHPFSKGIVSNMLQLFAADREHPMVWSLAQREMKMLG